MKIQFIGTGGAFDWQVGNSSAILEFRGKRFLIDCGHSVFPKLMELDLADTIDYLLLTHLHDDHCGSASTFIFAQHYVLGKRPFPVVAATPVFAEELAAFFRHACIEVPKYAELVPASEIDGLTVIDTTGRHFPGMRTHAFLFEDAGRHLLFSGDIGDPDFLFKQLEIKGIENATVFHDVAFFDVPTHALYRDVARHQAQHTIYGYHHNPLHNPPDNSIPLVHDMPGLRAY